ncbi:hypothetical protein F4604DRAFT_1922615 [Suillus subluteus]|nr:hypothetical protein F4604DRAFT_1922615 [Suillus subluteus]
MPPKKLKLSWPELQLAYEGLIKLQKSLVYEEEEEGRAPENFKEQLENMVSESYTFSGVTMDDLTKFNITDSLMLDLKPDFVQNVEKTKLDLGRGRILVFCESALSINETNARAWIDAFLFRASSMLPSNKRMILTMEHHVPITNISSTNYTAMIPSLSGGAVFDLEPISFRHMKTNKTSGFFVIEAKLDDLENCIAQAVTEMYACGRFLEQKILRGALTDGHRWIFLLMKLNDDYSGASYARSPWGKRVPGPTKRYLADRRYHYVRDLTSKEVITTKPVFLWA